MDGILLINKKENMTSFDVVAKVRKQTHERSVGHTGTLDPNATGLLILLLGKYTKLLPYCNHDKKEYIATFRFGEKTDTGDIWGNVIETKEVSIVSENAFNEALNAFKGHIKQVPPMVSAIKKDGKKLYELARNNITVEREARDVTIYELECLEYGDEIKIRAVVSGGTYIRTLCEDICEYLGNVGTMTSLIRTKIGHLSLGMACDIEDVNNHLQDITPYDLLKDELPLYEINDKQFADVKNGKFVYAKMEEPLIMLVHNKMIVAAYEKVEGNKYKSKRGLW